MGNNNSIDFTNHTTKNSLNEFLTKIDNDNEILKQTSDKIIEKIKPMDPSIQLVNVMDCYINMMSKCQYNSFVYLFSNKKREDCDQSKKVFMKELFNMGSCLNNSYISSEAIDKIKIQIELNDKILNINKAFKE